MVEGVIGVVCGGVEGDGGNGIDRHPCVDDGVDGGEVFGRDDIQLAGADGPAALDQYFQRGGEADDEVGRGEGLAECGVQTLAETVFLIVEEALEMEEAGENVEILIEAAVGDAGLFPFTQVQFLLGTE